MQAGWLNNNRKIIYSFLLMLNAVPVWADKNKTSELPDVAFLEFLAEMEEVDGDLISASDLIEQNFNWLVKQDIDNNQVDAANGQFPEDKTTLLKKEQTTNQIEEEKQ